MVVGMFFYMYHSYRHDRTHPSLPSCKQRMAGIFSSETLTKTFPLVRFKPRTFHLAASTLTIKPCQMMNQGSPRITQESLRIAQELLRITKTQQELPRIMRIMRIIKNQWEWLRIAWESARIILRISQGHLRMMTITWESQELLESQWELLENHENQWESLRITWESVRQQWLASVKILKSTFILFIYFLIWW